MKNYFLAKRIFSVLIVTVCAGLLTAGICLAADDSDTDTSGNSNVDIPKRAQEAITEANELSQAEREKAEATKRQQYLDEYHDEPAGSLLSKEDVNKIEQQRKEREQAVRSRAEQEVKTEGEETQASGGNTVAGSASNLPHVTKTPGTVTGIVLYMGKGAALVLGDVVREGDVVRGITVVRIMPDYVEFEKQGNKWKQQVGQTPPVGVWEKPNTTQQTPANKKQETSRKK
ncbi:MAG: hypothetical protein ABSB91_01120 [Sedimentisphaerales bacterium]